MNTVPQSCPAPQFCPYCGQRLRAQQQVLMHRDDLALTGPPVWYVGPEITMLDCTTEGCVAYMVTHTSVDYLSRVEYYVQHPPKTAKARK